VRAGVLCRLLKEKGAHVTGVDAAAELIRAARQRGPESIRYHIGDARELGFFPEAHSTRPRACWRSRTSSRSSGVRRRPPRARPGRALRAGDDAPGVPRAQGNALGLGQ
jgi:hypothetical protein